MYDNNKCQVRSYALFGEDIMSYAPYLVLQINEEDGLHYEIFKSDNLEDWRKEFAKDKALLIIDNEMNDPLGGDEQFLYECVFEKNTQVYISDDKVNVHGPLECEFMELWLAINENYYI